MDQLLNNLADGVPQHPVLVEIHGVVPAAEAARLVVSRLHADSTGVHVLGIGGSASRRRNDLTDVHGAITGKFLATDYSAPI